MIDPVHGRRREDGHDLSFLWWRPDAPLRSVSSALVGGGIGPLGWFLNAQVHPGYDRLDPAQHVMELAQTAGLNGAGVGMLTAVDVATAECDEDGGVCVVGTVGLGQPTWAAAPPERISPGADGRGSHGPTPIGTINLLVVIPDQLDDGCLVNLLATATEAKVQALFDAGVPATGTASDAICVAGYPMQVQHRGFGDGRESFGGPRSYWGSRTARAVYRVVRRGAVADTERAIARGWPRPSLHSG